MYSVRSDIGRASTISADPTTALANGFSSRKVRDLLTVTTICRTGPLSSFCDCAWACWRGPGPIPSSAEAMITGTKSKCRSRKPHIRRRAIRRLSPWLLRITVPPYISPSLGSHHRVPLTPHVADHRDRRRRPEHRVGTACRGVEQQAAYEGLRALARFDHWPLIQVPTVPIVAITAM